MSRTNIPTTSADGESYQCSTMLPTIGSIATESALPSASLAGLETIIEELKQSGQPLLQLYGNELNKSHREQLGQNDSQFVGGVIPLHEFLLSYHHECSQRKNQCFSEISAALSPSQNVEEVSQIAGLWPRITPRSILRQLAQDRISTLPNQWTLVIMRFAVSFLKYQQSLRLLELFSRQRHEELLWEIEAIRHDVLAESTPDWLLVQVRLFPCCKSSFSEMTP
jgi:ABC-type cobalamin transport system ATPase subunit